MEKRRDKCKCGKFITWSYYKNNEVICNHCGTVYSVESDSVMIYWLEEKIKTHVPFKTNAR